MFKILKNIRNDRILVFAVAGAAAPLAFWCVLFVYYVNLFRLKRLLDYLIGSQLIYFGPGYASSGAYPLKLSVATGIVGALTWWCATECRTLIRAGLVACVGATLVALLLSRTGLRFAYVRWILTVQVLSMLLLTELGDSHSERCRRWSHFSILDVGLVTALVASLTPRFALSRHWHILWWYEPRNTNFNFWIHVLGVTLGLLSTLWAFTADRRSRCGFLLTLLIAAWISYEFGERSINWFVHWEHYLDPLEDRHYLPQKTPEMAYQYIHWFMLHGAIQLVVTWCHANFWTRGVARYGPTESVAKRIEGLP